MSGLLRLRRFVLALQVPDHDGRAVHPRPQPTHGGPHSVTIELQTWRDLGDDQLAEWGNGPATLTLPDGTQERVLVLNWQETAQGTLSLFRHVCVDEEHGAFVPWLWRSLAAGQWASITNDGFVIDREAVARSIEAQAQQAAAERLAIPQGAVPINRQQRRQLERNGAG